VGAAALAVHGVSRATRDLDLLVTDAACLAESTWTTLREQGVTATIRRGDADDPLAGVVRLAAAGEAPVDLVIGRAGWQARVLARAGPQDAWDIAQLLDAVDRPALVAAVEASLPDLPDDARRLWVRVVEAR
jgi:hypothetical protein